MPGHRPHSRSLTAAALLLITAAPLSAQRSRESDADDRARSSRASDADWCRGWRDDDRESYCEERQLTLDARRTLRVDGRQNGGVQVSGWDRDEIRVVARVQVNARSEREARDIAHDVRISDGDVLRADGPSRLGRNEHWSVSYEIMVPRRTDLQLEASNGGLSVADVSGRVAMRTVNGGLHVSNAAGDVRGRTTNGGVTAELTGDRWEGTGLDLETTNGGVRLVMPRDYSAPLEMGTVNGGMQIDFPITVQGRLDRRRLNTQIGRGGAPIRVVTTNGGVIIRRR